MKTSSIRSISASSVAGLTDSSGRTFGGSKNLPVINDYFDCQLKLLNHTHRGTEETYSVYLSQNSFSKFFSSARINIFIIMIFIITII